MGYNISRSNIAITDKQGDYAMKILKKLSVVILILTSAIFVVSCGGGGGSTAPSDSGSITLDPVTKLSSAPSGSGSITLDPVTKVISGSFITVNVANVTAAHIHDGNAGVAGPVIIPLLQSPAGSGIWTVTASIPLTDAQIARLQAGGYYVNVHTTLNPAGEIRGQLILDSTIANRFNATLNLAQEVPAPINPG